MQTLKVEVDSARAAHGAMQQQVEQLQADGQELLETRAQLQKTLGALEARTGDVQRLGITALERGIRECGRLGRGIRSVVFVFGAV